MVHAMKLIFLSLVLLLKIGESYHHGGDDTNCWLGPNYVRLESSCDQVGDVNFTYSPAIETPLYTNEPFMIVAELQNKSELLRKNGYLVQHANIHMCRAEVGWCTPDVSAQPDLVTQSPPVQSDSRVLGVNDLRVSIAGDWSIVAHFTILTSSGEWDLAAGIKRRFIKRRTEIVVEAWAVYTMFSFASIGIVCAVITGVWVVLGRHHWVFRASSPNLSVPVAFGCFIAFVSVFTLAPPAHATETADPTANHSAISSSSSAQCNSRVWLLSLAFDFVLIPLALKTWRVSVLFAPSATFKRVNISDHVLTRLALVLLFIDCCYCLVWTLAFPLRVAAIPSLSNPESTYIVQCVGNNQFAFEVFSMIIHGLPLIWLAVLGRKVRSSFRKRTINNMSSAQLSSASAAAHRGSVAGAISVAAHPQEYTNELKLSQFNESESLALTLASLCCVSIFAVALQYTVTDSPTAQMLMVACGLIWSSFFVLVVMFVPRFIDFARLEKDGVTMRSRRGGRLTFTTATTASATTDPLHNNMQGPHQEIKNRSNIDPFLRRTISAETASFSSGGGGRMSSTSNNIISNRRQSNLEDNAPHRRQSHTTTLEVIVVLPEHDSNNDHRNLVPLNASPRKATLEYNPENQVIEVPIQHLGAIEAILHNVVSGDINCIDGNSLVTPVEQQKLSQLDDLLITSIGHPSQETLILGDMSSLEQDQLIADLELL